MSDAEFDGDLHIGLRNLVRDRFSGSIDVLNRVGGVEQIGEYLHVGMTRGIDSVDAARRREQYGSNEIQQSEQTSYFGFLREAFSDFTIILLACAGLVSLGIAIGYSKNAESYAKGAAILISVLIVTNVTAVNEFNKQSQFARLNATVQDVSDRCLRDGVMKDVKAADLVCGDIVLFRVGDIFSADGLLIDGADVATDESALTGEPKLIRKDPVDSPFLLSGTKVMEGEGRYLVIAVGVNSEAGQIRELVRDKKKKKKKDRVKPSKDTQPSTSAPAEDMDSGGSILTTKLHKIAVGISKFAFILAAIVLIITCIRFSIVTYAISDPNTVCAFVYNGICGSADVNSYASDPSVGFSNCSPSNTLFPCCSQVVDGAQLLGAPCPWMKNHLNDFLSFIITAITIIVVVIPEGLPLAVTLSLAFSVRKMQSDNNLVKHLDACETMGSATIICSDKTGTLTKNRMTVVKSVIGGSLPATCLSANLDPYVKDLWAEGIATFGTADIKFNKSVNLWDQIGSKTECALLQTLPDLLQYEKPYGVIRAKSVIVRRIPFNSAVKKSCVVIQKDGFKRLYTIGASEIVLESCSYILNVDNESGGPRAVLLTAGVAKSILNQVEEFANLAMRTIVVAFKDVADTVNVDSLSVDEAGLTFIGLVGIEDPLREQVPVAIAKCNRAGVDVKMVTGDNLNTAIAIARSAGIIRDSDMDTRSGDLKKNIAMTGPEFRGKILDNQGRLDQHEIDLIWPHLRVLARSSPADKYLLVSGIMASSLVIGRSDRQVVAVTGDGTNDAPALKKADVGFAMGITGTSVARDAADIILLDDNFASIVLACKWGRNVYDSVAKFMQFQLTVMVVAVIIALEGVFIYYESPVSAVQMLWINLIMNALASLSLATEPPTESLLDRPPYGRKQSMISGIMLWNILGHATYQLLILNLFLFLGADWLGVTDGRDLGPDAPPGIHFTFIFNCLVFMQLTNQINSRKLHHEVNVFSRIFSNPYFLIILITEAVLQVIFVQFGGAWLGTAPLPGYCWGYTFAVALGSFPIQQLIIAVRKLVLTLNRRSHKLTLVISKDKTVPEPKEKLEALSPSGGDNALAADALPMTIIPRKSSTFQFDRDLEAPRTAGPIQRDNSSISLPGLLSRRAGEATPVDGTGDWYSSRKWTNADRKLQRYFSHKKDEEDFLTAAREYMHMRERHADNS